MKCRNKYKKMHLLGQSRKNPLVQVKQLGIKKITGKNRWYAHPIIEVSAKCRLETAYAKWWTNVGTYQRLLKQSMKGKCCLAAIVGERKEDVPQLIVYWGNYGKRSKSRRTINSDDTGIRKKDLSTAVNNENS